VTGYILKWFTPTDDYPSSTNPVAHGWESNSQPVDHKSNTLTFTLPSHLTAPVNVTYGNLSERTCTMQTVE